MTRDITDWLMLCVLVFNYELLMISILKIYLTIVQFVVVALLPLPGLIRTLRVSLGFLSIEERMLVGYRVDAFLRCKKFITDFLCA